MKLRKEKGLHPCGFHYHRRMPEVPCSIFCRRDGTMTLQKILKGTVGSSLLKTLQNKNETKENCTGANEVDQLFLTMFLS